MSGQTERAADITTTVTPEDDCLYLQTRRYGRAGCAPAGYSVPLPRGRYRVTLHFAEIQPGKEAGYRRFDVLLEGDRKLEDYDSGAASSGGVDAHTFNTTVDDAFLDIQFVRTVKDPLISAIEIERERSERSEKPGR